jgi:hypothetical protein
MSDGVSDTMHKYVLLLVVGLVFVMFNPAVAKDVKWNPKIKVKIDIKARHHFKDKEVIKEKMLHCISKELKRYPDVEIMQDRPLCTIEIILEEMVKGWNSEDWLWVSYVVYVPSKNKSYPPHLLRHAMEYAPKKQMKTLCIWIAQGIATHSFHDFRMPTPKSMKYWPENG